MSDYSPDTDTELLAMVRSVTDYSTSRLDTPSLDTHLKVAKLRLANETGSDDFYGDDGLAQALLFTTAVLAKCAVENYAVEQWNVGNAQIQASATDGDAAQLKKWAELAADGLKASDVANATHNIRITNDYLNDNRGL